MRLYGQAARLPAVVLCCCVLLLAADGLPAATASAQHPRDAINTLLCPTGDDIIHVPVDTDLSDAFDQNGPGKTYLLPPGNYALTRPITVLSGSRRVTNDTLAFPGPKFNESWAAGRGDVLPAGPNTTAHAWLSSAADANKTVGVTATGLTTCFIGDGKSEDIVITATSRVIFRWSSYDGDRIRVGLKSMIIDGKDSAGGMDLIGQQLNSELTFTGDVTIEASLGYRAVLLIESTARFTESSTLSVKDNKGGGGFQVTDGSTLSVLGSAEFINNEAGGGSAVNAMDSAIEFSSVRFSGNTAGGSGAVYMQDCHNAKFGSAQFTNNTATEIVAGALRMYGCRGVYFGSAQFSNNTARNVGGALLIEDGDATFGSAQFTHNTAGSDGGAVCMQDSHINFGSVCIQQNVAANTGSGIFMASGSRVNFTSPDKAQMANNSPGASSIAVSEGSSWTCAGSEQVARGPGTYDVTGAICACMDAAASGGSASCSCPVNTLYYPSACACGVCEPNSSPCCADTAQLAPCTRLIDLATSGTPTPVDQDVEVVATISDVHATNDVPAGRRAAAWANPVPAANVPVTFAVHGDCDPDLSARTVYTDAQGRARVVLGSRRPGVAVVVAAVVSDGSLPRQAVMASTRIKWLPPYRHELTYDTPDGGDDGHEHSSHLDHTRKSRRYEAEGDIEAYEAVATTMALQALDTGAA